MNYLAHLFLSQNYPRDIPGNFLADMMTIEEIRLWPETMKHGVYLHRFIDQFTDNHPENKAMRRILRPYFRKYAGVALDLFYDYILYQNWHKYSRIDFEVFTRQQYSAIRLNKDLVPDRLRYTVDRMIRHDFLQKFTTLEGQSKAFEDLDHRASFYTGFGDAMMVLSTHQDELQQSFNRFFPEIIWRVAAFNGD